MPAATPDYRDVNPRELRCSPARPSGADIYKLHQQIKRYGVSFAGMPPPEVLESLDGYLVLYNGSTRATRMARLAPGTLIRVQVTGRFNANAAKRPKIGDTIP